jgi:hypothetical protein
MKIKYPEIGICGLSCRLCPMYHIPAESRCEGCKSEGRMKVGCKFITCAVKNKGIEFCWKCKENESCEKWKKHREYGKKYDTPMCYQKLEDNITFIQHKGLSEFQKQQKTREKLLKKMLSEFNEGRSKSYYCIASTVLNIDELKEAIEEAKNRSKDILDIKKKSKLMHSILDEIAEKNKYILKIRKYKN